MSDFDFAHHLTLGSYSPLHGSDRPDTSGGRREIDPHPYNREIARCGNHSLLLNWRGEFYDRVPVHGAAYLGKAQSPRDAFSRWKNHLMSIGVRAEEAVLL